MNLANKLTIFRIVLVPFFVAALMINQIPYNLIIALGIFAAASITDWLDGFIARKYNQITDLGKFLDPIADKILVMAALVCFAGLGWVYPWIVVVILARDFIVGAIRLAAVEGESKIVIPARLSGKIKTAVTMAAICAILLFPQIANISMYACAALTVISGWQYVWDSREILRKL
jgi:CDP-diacylglycerol--glycerol-3-phosphate 3-phosphatidyltransferase